MGFDGFPFGIEYVCDLMGMDERIPSGDRRSFYTTCPFCGKKRKMNVSTEKDTFRCPACDTAGGMLTLYAMGMNMSFEDAKRELKESYYGTPPEVRTARPALKEEELHRVTGTAPLGVRDRAYAALIRHLTLTEAHRKSLEGRGLPFDRVRKLGYRSTPQESLGEIGKAVEESAGVSTAGVPGFYGGRLVWRKPGILLPVRQADGRISGMQIRYDSLPENATEEEREAYHKYVWLTSAEKPGGASIGGCENIHFAGFVPGAGRIFLTEGVLKADIASYISGQPFLGLTGVGNTSRLPEVLEFLKGTGTREVYVCLDMDYRTNPNVFKAMEKIHGIIEGAGLSHRSVEWDARFKGIDDLLWHKRKQGLV